MVINYMKTQSSFLPWVEYEVVSVVSDFSCTISEQVNFDCYRMQKHCEVELNNLSLI